MTAFTIALAVSTGLLFGLAPALHAARSDISNTLRAGTRAPTAGTARARSVLVLAEISLATALLIGAGLLIHSFERLTRVDPGSRPNHLVVFDVALRREKYRYDPQQYAFANDVMARLASLPGAQAVAVMATRPLDPNPGFLATTSFTVDRGSRNQTLASTERTSAA